MSNPLNNFYNRYHRKNRKIQKQIISDRNYTYQTITKLSKIFLKSKGAVLDVGCGVGTISLYLASKGHDVIGIDISSRAIKLAKSSAKQIGFKYLKFENSDVSTLNKFAVKKFDYVICSEVIEHVKDDKQLLKDIYKLLKPGGVLVLSTPSINAPLYRWGYLDEFDKNVGHLRRYSVKELTNKIDKSGFHIIQIYKTEGLLRNSLYTFNQLGLFVRFIRWPISIVVNIIDNFFVKIFGESDICVVAKK